MNGLLPLGWQFSVLFSSSCLISHAKETFNNEPIPHTHTCSHWLSFSSLWGILPLHIPKHSRLLLKLAAVLNDHWSPCDKVLPRVAEVLVPTQGVDIELTMSLRTVGTTALTWAETSIFTYLKFLHAWQRQEHSGLCSADNCKAKPAFRLIWSSRAAAQLVCIPWSEISNFAQARPLPGFLFSWNLTPFNKFGLHSALI